MHCITTIYVIKQVLEIFNLSLPLAFVGLIRVWASVICGFPSKSSVPVSG